MRRYDVPLEVRTEPDRGGRPAPQEPPPPAQFLWRDRLYVVREVLGAWRERTAWWKGAVGAGVHGDDGPAGVDGAGVDARTALHARWDASDRWVWRVEASAGRSGSAGTYEIAREGPTGSGGDGDATWRMVRVSD